LPALLVAGRQWVASSKKNWNTRSFQVQNVFVLCRASNSSQEKWVYTEALVRELIMQQFEQRTISAMRALFEEVCSHIPRSATSARTVIASCILETARNGEETYDALLEAGRRAVIEQFGMFEAIRVEDAAGRSMRGRRK
jgi:hypothetical protein